MSMLSIVQAIAEEVGFAAPTYVAGNPDRTAKQLLRLVNRSGYTLASRHDWHILQLVHTFTTQADVYQYPVPTDLSRFVSDTAWNRTEHNRLRGGMTAQEWQAQKSSLATPASLMGFRIRNAAAATSPISSAGRVFELDRVPPAGLDLVIEYISLNWARNSAGTEFKPAFTSDDDEPLLPPALMELDGIWRFRAAKGMDYAEAKRDFDLQLDTRFGSDSVAPTISLGSRSYGDIRGMNIPESGFG